MKSLERDGFEIAPDCLPLSTVDALTAALENSPLHRSRAGMRNVLQLEAVRALALDPLLLNLAKASLGFQALPFRATLFDKSSDSNWLVCGIKIRLCHCVSGRMCQDGDRGPSKKESSAHTPRPRHSLKCWRFAFT